MMYVLDTSAILSRRFNITAGDVIVPQSVVDEIRKGRMKVVLDSLEGIMRIESPTPESIAEVKAEAGKSGDLSSLSETDIDVIALAYQFSCTLISDDYAIQNVASHLSVRYMGADLSVIRREVTWRYRCTGCRKTYDEPVESCSVCGHEVVRTRAGAVKRKAHGNVNDRIM